MQNESKEYLPIFSCKRVGKKKKKKDKIFYCPLIIQNSRNVHEQLFSGWKTFQNENLSQIPMLLKSHLLLEGILGSKFFSQL